MSEIEKLYKNAGFIQKQCKDYSCIVCNKNKDCDKYPPFTAEKQLELLCFLINFGVEITMQKCNIPIKLENIANNLTGITNEIWQDLTEQEKAEIRKILNEG